ncbi:MAG: hypothetical protein V4732_09870 [Pseudomonadota bacterium]
MRAAGKEIAAGGVQEERQSGGGASADAKDVGQKAREKDMISALKMERDWLRSLSPEDADTYFKWGGLTGNTGEALEILDFYIKRQLLVLTTSGIQNVINDYPSDTAGGAFAEMAKTVDGKMGKAGSVLSAGLSVKSVDEMSKLVRLFGNDKVQYEATYVCGSSCKLNIIIKE